MRDKIKRIEVSDCFLESQRHDKGKCLALDEVLGNDVEIGLPSSPNGIDIV